MERFILPALYTFTGCNYETGAIHAPAPELETVEQEAARQTSVTWS